MKKNNLIFIVLGLLIVLFLLFVKPGFIGNAIVGSEDILIPLSEISETAKFYEVDGIEFFVVKASDGSIKTAFNACDVCYSSKKGYSQQGDVMVCNNCGSRYPIIGLGTENVRGGGCWPGYLPSGVSGDNLIIKQSDIEKGAYRF